MEVIHKSIESIVPTTMGVFPLAYLCWIFPPPATTVLSCGKGSGSLVSPEQDRHSDKLVVPELEGCHPYLDGAPSSLLKM